MGQGAKSTGWAREVAQLVECLRFPPPPTVLGLIHGMYKLGVMVYTWNVSTQEVEKRGSNIHGALHGSPKPT